MDDGISWHWKIQEPDTISHMCILEIKNSVNQQHTHTHTNLLWNDIISFELRLESTQPIAQH